MVQTSFTPSSLHRAAARICALGWCVLVAQIKQRGDGRGKLKCKGDVRWQWGVSRPYLALGVLQNVGEEK